MRSIHASIVVAAIAMTALAGCSSDPGSNQATAQASTAASTQNAAPAQAPEVISFNGILVRVARPTNDNVTIVIKADGTGDLTAYYCYQDPICNVLEINDRIHVTQYPSDKRFAEITFAQAR